MICRHIRRTDPQPRQSQWVLRCDCGWEARTAQFDGQRPRGRDEVEEALDGAFVAHLGPEERRTYLLVDSRPGIAPGQIVGVFVMPEAVPVRFLADRIDDGVRYGSFRIGNGPRQELPIGEVRTPTGRVFRLDQ